MKELIYIHASTGYLATHFFNAQQSYPTSDDDEPDSATVNPDVSFREGLAPDGSVTSCPRLLLFNYKDKFGSLSHINALHTGEVDASLDDLTWTGPIIEHRQDAIPQSSYHARLDAGENEDDNDNASDTPNETTSRTKTQNTSPLAPADLTPSIRFWSDFSRVFYHPRGLHRVPDPAEWEREIGWARGVERFMAYDAEHAVLEDSFRLFAEECDLLQGVQLSLDAPSFGAFTVSLLSQFRDEYSKLPVLTFCALSAHDPAAVDLGDTRVCSAALNDAMTLHELVSLATLTVPLQQPSTWRRGAWSKYLTADFTDTYHSSAILAAHVESATLPLRLNPAHASSTDLATLCAQLNWRGDTPLAALSGAFPFYVEDTDTERDFKTHLYDFDFSHPASLHKGKKNAGPFARRDVFRGLGSQEEESVRRWVETWKLREPLVSTTYLPTPYHIPSSHPQFFTRLDSIGRPLMHTALPSQSSPTTPRIRTLPTHTTLATTPSTGDLAASYAKLAEGVLRRGVGARVLEVLGVESEVVREVGEGWWRLVGAYGGDEESEGERAEDES